MKLDELKVTQKYSSIIPNAETEKTLRDSHLGCVIHVGTYDDLKKLWDEYDAETG